MGQEKLGPRIEFGSSTTVLLGLHFFNTGALSYAVLAGDDEELNFSIGGSIGLRHYFDARGAQAGPYVGGFAEYASITVTDDSDDLARYDRLVLIPAFDAGYRWVWGNFLLDLGGHLGAAFVTVAEDTPIGPSGEEDPSAGCVYADSCLEEADTMVFGMVVVDVGFLSVTAAQEEAGDPGPDADQRSSPVSTRQTVAGSHEVVVHCASC